MKWFIIAYNVSMGYKIRPDFIFSAKLQDAELDIAVNKRFQL